MGFKEGASCACRLENWEGSRPHCSGSQEDFDRILDPYFGHLNGEQQPELDSEDLKPIKCEGCGKEVPTYTAQRNTDNEVLGECCRPARPDTWP